MIDKKNSFYQASQPDGKHLSKIRLLEEVVRQKGTPHNYSFSLFLKDAGMVILLNDENNSIRVRNIYGGLFCSKNVFGEDPCFYNGPWFNEIEEYRSEIEENMKKIESEQKRLDTSQGTAPIGGNI